MNFHLLRVAVALFLFSSCPPYSWQEKLNLDALNNYSEFLNLGEKKLHKLKKDNYLENSIFKSKIEVLGELFKKNVQIFKAADKLDIVFLVDASSSIGSRNFKSELKFIKKLLSDITVDYDHTRVAVVTFSSPSDTTINIDDIADPSEQNNKCLLLNEQLMNIEYKGGETYTAGGFQKAKEIFEASHRNDSKKLIFLVTDGYSSGENPIPLSNELKSNHQVTVFTIGIRNGNYKELYELSSTPGEFHSYLLDSFEEFESLARRALHVDLSEGDYLPLTKNKFCDKLCEGGDCCDDKAICTCGTTTGHYTCICQPGFYGSGLRNNCMPCIPGTYSDGPNLCLPCPDVHHTTVPPAHGIQSCVCKKGFQSDSDGNCQVLKCPVLKAPEFGYIVKKKECSNVLNSACGVRCEVGYILVGSSIRLCQENATWSGSNPTCEVKTCSKPPTPKYGSVKCEQPDLGVVYDKTERNLPVDTVCDFECNKGTLQIGSSQRNCLPIAQWDGLRTICKPIKCNKFPQVKYGTVEPLSCKSGKQEYGKVCTITCNDGFEASGPVNKTCGDYGLWAKKTDGDTLCKDVTPPNLMCPKNVTGFTVSGASYGHVTWKEPNITDNSALSVLVWIQPAIQSPENYKFSIGLTPVTYFAQDAFKNAIKCKFFVEIRDKEPPTIEGCISPSTFLVTRNAQENITWDEPNIFDNSQNVTVTKSHEFGVFSIGTTLVTYTATDPSGNINICNINITVEDSQCPDLEAPSNGAVECSDQSEGVNCVITCEEGYAIPISSSGNAVFENRTSFVCNHADAVWSNQDGLVLPECSVTVVADHKIQGDLELPLQENVSCNATQKIEEIQNTIETSITNSLCGTEPCEVHVESECDVEKSEEDTNKLLTKRRRKRQIVEDSAKTKKTGRTKSHRRRKKLKLKFRITGKNLSNDTSNVGVTVAGTNSTAKFETLKFSCPSGFIPRKNKCVQCPRGTFHDNTTNICQSCDFGFYNDKVGQTACIACPLNHSTRKMHVKTFSECKKMCPPGTYARRKKVRISKKHNATVVDRATLSPYCKSCPIGTYQSHFGQTECIPCPTGYTTTKTHSISENDCIPGASELCKTRQEICNNGRCLVVNQYEFSCECLPGYAGTYCQQQVLPCDSQPCNNGGTCMADTQRGSFSCSCPPGFSGNFCETTLELEPVCNLTCQNGGICLDLGENEYVCVCASGFSGDKCEMKTSNCEEGMCENNSTCVEDGGSFKCVCARGFLGRRCSIVPCDYKPCNLTSVCISLPVENATKADFRCVCPEGYTGPDCSDKINYCVSSPCQNEGECMNEETTYKCACGPLFYGNDCGFRRDTNYVLHFPRYNVNDYIKLRGFGKDLTEITACLWIQTLDNFNYGTLLSYATDSTDNAFTLTDYTGLVLYVNKQYVVTDVFLNDGHWHHICSSWSSSNGSYQIFVDGKLTQNGSDLATGTKIQAHGYFVVGQEQDVLGGRFSQSESFVGNMAYIDVWSRVLREEEIVEHQNDCSDSMLGDLYAWPEMQDHINGNIEKIPSTFCQGCEYPNTLYNGYIDMRDNKAFYSCYRGFELNSKQFVNGRRCTKTSTWEGFYEPYCKKIDCGYPGLIRNGHFTGTHYSYNEKITYQCYDGYHMVGSPVMVCKEDGQWFPQKPKCIGGQCTLPSVRNGKVQIILQANEAQEDSSKVDVDTQILIVCFENATLIGDSLATCLEDGTWDNLNVSCKYKLQAVGAKSTCPTNQVPSPPLNGYIEETSLLNIANGTTDFVEYKCRPGYQLLGLNISMCIIDGYWTDPNVTCEAVICSQPPNFAHMSVKLKDRHNFTYGNMLSYECDEGYTMIGQGSIRCTDSSEWSRMQAKCVKISCGQPPLPLDSQIDRNTFLFGDTVTITCKSSRQSYNVTCLKDGSWTPVDYTCSNLIL